MRQSNWPGAMLGMAAFCTIAIGPGASAQTGGSVPQSEAEQADQIVVTAQRTGIPVWRVTSPTTTLVLIGAIDGVTKDTRWDPGALTDTLLKADRVMFPGAMGIAVSPFQMVGYYFKFRKMGTLPKGQTLAAMLPPAQYQRLVALQKRGILKKGFERKHPLHLSITLRGIAEGKPGFGADASSFVGKAVRKHKIKTVPIRMMKGKAVAKDFFATPAKAYIPCLLDSVALVEAGPGTVKARSVAWAERRVPDVLASPADIAFDTCSPGKLGWAPRPDLRSQISGLMAEPQLTVAVVNLRELGRPGGVLDSLASAGFDISGPNWKR